MAPLLGAQFDKPRLIASTAGLDLRKRSNTCDLMDLRGKAADHTADGRVQKAACDLLGHKSVGTMKRHYLSRGKIVTSEK